ncbi:hypothetical protein EUX98_g6991 [Antrodiella citrinella]|uniref:Cytochrome P450 n=1 Tax=Antrodiella citrinella TaxID=2447956 RepID=A0A4S4MPE8_9APHY|nr:hypothetical protein EUX98_g6991 [Antrodiella citrinella]
MGADPDEFFKEASEKLGPIFRVKAMGRSMTYVTSPALIAAIYRDSKTFEFQSIRSKISHDIFSIPKDVIQSSDVIENYYPAHHRVLAPKSISPILDRYAAHTYSQLSARVSALDGASAPLKSLVIMPAYVAASKAFFGEKLPAAGTYKDFEKFNDAFHIMAAELPKFVTSGARKAWEGVTKTFETYIHDVRKSGDMSELVDSTLGVGDRAGWTDAVLAKMLASDMWALQANAIWAVYWFLILVLERPDDLTRITYEIDAARAAWTQAHPNTPLNETTFPQFITESAEKFPLLSSGIMETLRLRTSSFSIRRVTAPTEFAGYSFKTDDVLICNTRVVHMDEEIHERPTEFVLDRYVDAGKKRVKDGAPVPNHSLPFGGGVSMCEGRHFAQAEIKTFLVALLTLTRLEFDPEEATWPTPAMDRIGVGIIGPKGDLDVVVRSR